MSAPVLVVGHRGMVGRAWTTLLEARGVPARGLSRPEIDLRSEESLARALDRPLRAVVNAAAYTDVDGAEADEETALEVNGRGVARLVARCDELGVPLIHYSTDYVFDGRARRDPYPVDHPTAPVNAYGRSKLAGEEAVLASRGPHLLVRTSWIYAPWGKNFVRTIAGLAARRDELQVVDDQRGRPTSAEHLARVSWELLESGARGVFHVTDGGACSWFELAAEIARRRSPACRVEPCTSDAFPRPAPRPAYSVLDLSRTESVVGPMPLWTDNLTSVLARLDL